MLEASCSYRPSRAVAFFAVFLGVRAAAPSASSVEHVKGVFNELKELGQTHIQVAERMSVQEEVTMAEEQLSTKFTVAALGAFSSGKSTLINTLVGEKVCEVGIKPTTTEVVYVPVPWSTGEWAIVDTPGLDALDDVNHKKECLAMARKADMALLLVNARQALRESELPLIEEFTRSNPEVAIVVNYWNYVEEKEDQEECIRHVETTLYRLMPGASNLPIFMMDARKASDDGVGKLKKFLTEKVSMSLVRF